MEKKKKTKNFRSKVNFHFLFGNKGKRSDDDDGTEDFHDNTHKSKDDTDGKPKLISIKDIEDIERIKDSANNISNSEYSINNKRTNSFNLQITNEIKQLEDKLNENLNESVALQEKYDQLGVDFK